MTVKSYLYLPFIIHYFSFVLCDLSIALFPLNEWGIRRFEAGGGKGGERNKKTPKVLSK